MALILLKSHKSLCLLCCCSFDCTKWKTATLG